MTVATVQRRYCVVTPYYREERALLERCMASVQRQAPRADHILIADGFPQDWIDAMPVRHIRLDRAHGDYGNAARGLGALLAIAEGYDGIAFLDADNWYDDDHLASCLAAAGTVEDVAYVVAQRRLCRPDASAIAGTPADAPHSDHVDTNCYLLLRGSFAHLHRWCTIPKGLAAYGDQIFGKILRAASLPAVIVGHRTVNYLCMSESIYQQSGETPPPGCKPIIRWRDAQAWIYALPPAERLHLERMTGLTVAEIDPAGLQDGAVPVPEPSHINVEVPGSPQPARLRRTTDDVVAYRRIFVEQLHARADLPARASLIVDAAAGIGIASLDLHMRYPDAALLAVEPAAEVFELLCSNLDGRHGCSVLLARVVATPGQPPVGSDAGMADYGRCPVLTLEALLQRLGGATIDLLRLAPDQWQDVSLADLMALEHVRAVLIDTPNGPECIVVPGPDSAELPGDAVQSLEAA